MSRFATVVCDAKSGVWVRIRYGPGWGPCSACWRTSPPSWPPWRVWGCWVRPRTGTPWPSGHWRAEQWHMMPCSTQSVPPWHFNVSPSPPSQDTRWVLFSDWSIVIYTVFLLARVPAYTTWTTSIVGWVMRCIFRWRLWYPWIIPGTGWI